MLYKSGVNLESSTIKFIESNDTITLFSAYLKLEELKSINKSKRINRIIVRWEIRDLCLKVSDIELYEYCLKNNIALYRNTRIHLKTFWNGSRDIFFGSANVSGRGIGEKGKFNYELNGSFNHIDFDDISYLNKIILESEYVTSNLYGEILKLVEDTVLPTIVYPVIETKKKREDYFLLSNLPMTETVEELYNGYCNPESLDIDEINYVTHDIALYKIPQRLNKSEFFEHIKEAFNSHPFIIKLKDHIKGLPSRSLNYGGVIRWLQNNTTSVPTPRSWEFKKKEIVNILYNWVCFCDKDFSIIRPNYSEVIIFKNEKER